MRGSYAFVFFAADGWWTSAGWWEDDPAAAVALASAQPVRLVPHPAAAASYSASPAAASAGVHASSELTSACDDAALRPRVLPHLDPATRAAVPGAWDVVWTGGSGGSSTLYYATSRPQGHALPCAGRGGSGGASVPATVATFAVQDLCGAPATTYGFFRPGQTRTATVVGLLGGTTLYYCMDDLTASDEGPAGGLHTFTAPPDARSSSATSSGFGLAGELGGGGLAPPVTTLAVFGDLGRGTLDDSDLWHQYGSPAVGTARRLAAEADAGTLHGVFHVGDISYSVGYLSAWDYYLDMACAFTSKVPYIINQVSRPFADCEPPRIAMCAQLFLGLFLFINSRVLTGKSQLVCLFPCILLRVVAWPFPLCFCLHLSAFLSLSLSRSCISGQPRVRLAGGPVAGRQRLVAAAAHAAVPRRRQRRRVRRAHLAAPPAAALALHQPRRLPRGRHVHRGSIHV